MGFFYIKTNNLAATNPATNRQPSQQQTFLVRQSTPSEVPAGGILPHSVPQIHLRCRAVRCRKCPVPIPFVCHILTASVTVSGYGEVGAFAGSFCDGVLEDCTASGQVRAVPAQDAAAYDELPTAIGGFIGFSVQGTVINCESSVYISTMVSSNWVGAFAGYVQSFRAENCIYDEQKAPGWEVVDVVYNTSPGDRQDIRAA